MLGVHSIGSAPEQAELEGWSSEMKARSALGADRPEGAPFRVEVAPAWRINGLTRRPEGGPYEPPRRATMTGGADAACWARKRLRSSSLGATEAAGNLSGHRTCHKAGTKARSPLAPALALATGAGGALLIAGRVAVSAESGSAEGKLPAHPYLARQMSDFGFRQTL